MTDTVWADQGGVVAVPGAAPEARHPTASDEGRPLGRNISSLAGAQLVTWTMTLLWTLVVPRALGPAGWGLIVSAMSVSGVAGIVLGLGTRTYLVRELVVNRAAAATLVGTALVLRRLLAPLFTVSVIAYAGLSHSDHEARLVLYLLAASTLLTLLAEPMQAGFQAIERMQYLAYSDIINKSAQALTGIALVVLGFRATGIAVNLAVVAAAIIVLNAFWLRRFVRIDVRTNTRKLVHMARQSLAYGAFGVFSMLYLWIDTIMLSLMTRAEVVGWYGAPIRLFQTLMFLPVLLSTAWLPRLVAAFEEGPERVRAAARMPLELVVVLSVPIAAGTAILADPMIHLLYGSAYGNAVPVMVVLGLCIPPMYLNIMLAAVLVAEKRQTTWTWVMAGATLANPPLNLLLIPLTQSRYGNGAIGASLSLLVTELLIVGVGFALVGRSLFGRDEIRRCLLCAAATTAMCAVFYAARPLGLGLALPLAASTFVLFAAALRIATPAEVAFVKARLSRFPRVV